MIMCTCLVIHVPGVGSVYAFVRVAPVAWTLLLFLLQEKAKKDRELKAKADKVAAVRALLTLFLD